MKKFLIKLLFIVVFSTKTYAVTYTNEDGTEVSAYFHGINSSGFSDTNIYGEGITESYRMYGAAINGVRVPMGNWYVTQILNWDSDGRVIGKWDMNGNVLESYKYDSNGKIMAYNSSGNLIGVYNNSTDMIVSRDGRYDKSRELNYCDDNGTYTEKDSNNNIIGTYYQNGDYTKNKYNSKGELVSSSKYDKNGNVKESSVNVYDGGGNLVQQYKNGQQIYAKKIYTQAEAASALNDSNDNTVSITW